MKNPYMDEPTVTHFDLVVTDEVVCDYEGDVFMAAKELAFILGYDESFVDFIPYDNQNSDIIGRVYY